MRVGDGFLHVEIAHASILNHSDDARMTRCPATVPGDGARRRCPATVPGVVVLAFGRPGNNLAGKADEQDGMTRSVRRWEAMVTIRVGRYALSQRY